ncbi:hybrid sensor histidine kinase/response regulator [Dyella agri]|uniref:histidine kinase n=1 Tax=Dyella agri TaxID=1926869 RepID=A0ABW8KCI7_9GAMM
MFASLVLGAVLSVAAPVPGTAGAGQAGVAATAPAPATGLLPTPQFKHFDMSDGLPSSAINAVVQDQRGFMWFGGSGGLVRYDGVEFKTYAHVPDEANALSSNDITQLVCATDGKLWIGTGDAGLDRLDPATGRFEHWQHDPKNPASLSSDVVSSLAQDSDGSLWVGTRNGLEHLSQDGARLEHVAYLKAIGGGTGSNRDLMVGALKVDTDGTLWIGTWSGLLLKRLPDGSIRQVQVVHGEDKPDQIWRINGSGKDLRIGTRLGLLHVDGDGVARPMFDAAQLAPEYAFDSARDRSGRLWVATLHGVVMVDPHTGIHRFHSQPLVLGGLPGEWTWRVVADREGGLWFTFYDGGIAYLAPGWEGFSRYTHIPDDPNSLRDTLASVVAPSADGKLWVGERGKLDKLDPATGKVEHALDDLKTEVISMAEAGDSLWFTVRGALHRYQDGKDTIVDGDHKQFTRPEILVKGEDGAIYVTVTKDGVVRIDTQTLQATPVPMPADAKDVDVRPSGLDMEGGVLWYANHEGLMRWNPSIRRMEFAPGVPRGEDILAFTPIGSTFWMLRNDGLEHYHWQNGSAVRDRLVGAAQGWKSPVVLGMDEDRTGRLWIFGQTGLWSFDPATGKFKHYGVQDGLINSEFINGAVRTAPDSPLYAPTQGGVIGFNPLQHRDRAMAPLLAVVGIDVHGSRGVHALPTSQQDITLAWDDRDLRVSVRALSYINPLANRYRFRMDGMDDGWVDTDNRGDREFVGLRAGDYTLHAEAAGAGGEWGQLAAPLHIHVQAPPWQRWWAWLLYVLAVVATVSWIMWAWRRRLAQRHRIELIEQRRALAEQASAAKTQFLATLSHEIRTPMTGVMGMAELLLNTPLDARQQDYTKAMQRSGGMLMKLLNDALDLVRIDAGRLELEPAPFDPRQLVEDVAQLEQGLAWSKGLRFVVEMADNLPAQAVGDAVRIKQVLLNLANNALKFTEHGSVTLRATLSGDSLLFSVSDTGPGIPEGSQARLFQRFEQEESPQRRAGSGLGLAICRELVEMMGGSIELQSRLGHGSTFLVRLPLIEVAAAPDEQAAPAETGERHLRLLLVEDDPIVAAVITGLLQQQGHAACHVANGLLALAELDRNRYDAVLLDLDLPGVDGFQVARLIRQRETGRHLPIVAVTARSGEADEAHAREAGMDGFLRKPLSGEQLAAMLARVLRGAGERAEAAVS